jgi:hypothetical protein
MKERRMHAAATQSPKPETVRAFIQAYFDAWKGTDEEKILDFFSPDVILYVPTGKLEGVTAVRDGLGLSPGLRQTVKTLLTVRCKFIVPDPGTDLGWACR